MEIFHQKEKISSAFYEINQKIQSPTCNKVEKNYPESCVIELIFEINHDKIVPYSLSIKCSIAQIFKKIEKFV